MLFGPGFLEACRPQDCEPPPCIAANPASDTVKVDFGCVLAEGAVKGVLTEGAVKVERQAKATLRRKEELLWQREVERSRTAFHRQEQAAVDAEERRKVRVARAETELERQRVAEARHAAEHAEMLRKRAEVAAERAAEEKVAVFLRAKGFSSVLAGRRNMLRTSYPLHVAVSDNDAEMVQLLLWAMADPEKVNSSGVAPMQLAQKLNKKGSHEAVLALFEAVERCEADCVTPSPRPGDAAPRHGKGGA